MHNASWRVPTRVIDDEEVVVSRVETKGKVTYKSSDGICVECQIKSNVITLTLSVRSEAEAQSTQRKGTHLPSILLLLSHS
jgi:hypothetical protein